MLALLVLSGACAPSDPADVRITLSTRPSPLGLGQNLFEATIVDAQGAPVEDAEVSILLLMPADPATNHPEMRTEGALNNAGAGRYNGIAMVTMAGSWDVTVTASRDGREIGRTTESLTAHLTSPSK